MTQKKQIQIDSFLQFKFLSSPSFSPDGSLIAFVVMQADEKKNNYPGDLYLADADGSNVRQLTVGGDAKSYCWAGKDSLLFPAKRSEKYKALAKEDSDFTVFYEISVHGGEAKEAFCLPIRVKAIRRIDDDLFLLTTFNHSGRQDFWVIGDFCRNGSGFHCVQNAWQTRAGAGHIVVGIGREGYGSCKQAVAVEFSIHGEVFLPIRGGQTASCGIF